MFSSLSNPRNLTQYKLRSAVQQGGYEAAAGGGCWGAGRLRVAVKHAGGQGTAPQSPGRQEEQGAVAVAGDSQQDQHARGGEAGPRWSWEVKSVGEGWVQGLASPGTAAQGYLQGSPSQGQRLAPELDAAPRGSRDSPRWDFSHLLLMQLCSQRLGSASAPCQSWHEHSWANPEENRWKGGRRLQSLLVPWRPAVSASVSPNVVLQQ